MANNIQPPPPAHLSPPNPNPGAPELEFEVIDPVAPRDTARNGTFLQDNKHWLLPMLTTAGVSILTAGLGTGFAHSDAQAKKKAEQKDD